MSKDNLPNFFPFVLLLFLQNFMCLMTLLSFAGKIFNQTFRIYSEIQNFWNDRSELFFSSFG